MTRVLPAFGSSFIFGLFLKVYEQIVHVDDDDDCLDFGQYDFIHEALECGCSVGEAHRHEDVLVEAPFELECCALSGCRPPFPKKQSTLVE